MDRKALALLPRPKLCKVHVQNKVPSFSQQTTIHAELKPFNVLFEASTYYIRMYSGVEGDGRPRECLFLLQQV